MKKIFAGFLLVLLLGGCAARPDAETATVAPARTTPKMTSAQTPSPAARPLEAGDLYPLKDGAGYRSLWGAVDPGGNVVVPFEYASVEKVGADYLILGKYLTRQTSGKTERYVRDALASPDGTPLTDFLYNYMVAIDDSLIYGVSYDGAHEKTDILLMETGDTLLSFDGYAGVAHIGDALAVQSGENIVFYDYGRFLKGAFSARATIPDASIMDYSLKEGYISIFFDGMSYLADSSGKLAYGGYEGVDGFSDGYCAVMQGGKWGYIDKTGALAIPAQYDYAAPFSEGFAIVNSYDEAGNYVYSLIDKSGGVFIGGCSFILPFGEGNDYTVVLKAYDRKGQTAYSLDKQGALKPIGRYDVWDVLEGDIALVFSYSQQEESGVMGLYDLAAGRWLVEPGRYEMLNPAYQPYGGRAKRRVYVGQYRLRNVWLNDIIGRDGEVLVKGVNSVDYTDGDYAVVTRGFSYGLIDMEGNFVYERTIFTDPSME